MSTAVLAAVREHPILFSAPMVRAILEGRKTQTRRVVKPQPLTDVADVFEGKEVCWPFWWAGATCSNQRVLDALLLTNCPYGVPGDRLWVRETWGYDFRPSFQERHGISAPDRLSEVIYAADAKLPCIIDEEFSCEFSDIRWRPSIHMRRAASRITLEIVKVRVERVQDISGVDCEAEGLNADVERGAPYDSGYEAWAGVLRDKYRKLWDSINAKRGYGWDKDPWVWVIEFKRVTGAL